MTFICTQLFSVRAYLIQTMDLFGLLRARLMPLTLKQLLHMCAMMGTDCLVEIQTGHVLDLIMVLVNGLALPQLVKVS